MAAVPTTPDVLGDVYEPAEDTYLFLDAIQDETPFLADLIPSLVLELGPGSGVVGVYTMKQLASIDQPALLLAVDINDEATACTKETARLNAIHNIEIVRMDLLTQLQLRHQVDVLLFNPPYVPTPSEEVGSTGIEAAWAGGLHGREVIDRLLPLVQHLLSPMGVFYMVIVAENRPKDIARIMAASGFSTTVVRSRQAFNERLSILKFARQSIQEVVAEA
ncbi:methylase [Saprolegnia parasitica CBS 223.65]|uniref:Methylase n=1 Tax=Saprolegnia parasitica (strain CBS 223.65) TaxID=695850 RepID=A0A067BF60_SAPPC|nr:methylase [Saprolegnia parasitica CBS 223.65]KDO17024.1 methylase [Saprolegnia parasitica CBS 223.65]|eukprot:XP_012212267.1 methylase [Saprolegnia parasitica CBS 223.65]